MRWAFGLRVRLCLFDGGNGPRLGVVRRNHIVDVEACHPGLVPRPAAAMPLSAEQLHHVQALSASCPLPGALLRRDHVSILAEWEA